MLRRGPETFGVWTAWITWIVLGANRAGARLSESARSLRATAEPKGQRARAVQCGAYGPSEPTGQRSPRAMPPVAAGWFAAPVKRYCAELLGRRVLETRFFKDDLDMHLVV